MTLRAMVAVALAAVFGVELLGWPSCDRHASASAARTRRLDKLIAARQFSDALPLALEARRSESADSLLLWQLARVYAGLGRAADEAAAWEEYFRGAAATADVCLRLSDVYRSLNQPSMVVSTVDRCLKLDENQPELVGDRAAAHAALGNRSAAQADLEHAVTMQPTNPGFRIRLATLLLDARHPADAREHARAALEFEPGSDAARRILEAAQ